MTCRSEKPAVLFVDWNDMLRWLATNMTGYPRLVLTGQDGEGIAVVVVQQDGVCVRSGLAGPYPAGVDLDHAAQTIFADLVTALAIKQRMARVWWRNMDGPCIGQET